MNSITTEMTIAFTKDLHVLYAEDDLELQLQTKEFFEVLFKSVTVAKDGAEALAIYEQKDFDIVLTDIKMPTMDGIELTTRIRKQNKEQCIIVISAYNESEYLMKFINLNIKQFIQKPIDVENMLETLYQTSKALVNEKMVEEYRRTLEQSNQELTNKNNELQSLIRILDTKLLQIAKDTKHTYKKVDFETAEINEKNLLELKELEVDISGAAVLINLSKNLNVSNIQVLGQLFSSYAEIMLENDAYKDLAHKMQELGGELNSAPQSFIDRVDDISILLESFIYVLRIWREKVLAKEFTKAFELHTSMVTDITTVISIINGTEDEIENDMEFF